MKNIDKCNVEFLGLEWKDVDGKDNDFVAKSGFFELTLSQYEDKWFAAFSGLNAEVDSIVFVSDCKTIEDCLTEIKQKIQDLKNDLTAFV